MFARLDAWSVEQPPVEFIIAVTSSCCTAVVSVKQPCVPCISCMSWLLGGFTSMHAHAVRRAYLHSQHICTCTRRSKGGRPFVEHGHCWPSSMRPELLSSSSLLSRQPRGILPEWHLCLASGAPVCLSVQHCTALQPQPDVDLCGCKAVLLNSEAYAACLTSCIGCDSMS